MAILQPSAKGILDTYLLMKSSWNEAVVKQK
jgi:hypothetical protein